MKKLKKLLSIVLAVAMVMSLAVSVGASGYSITIKDPVTTDHTYNAYQIFSGTYDSDTNTLSDIEWGTGVDTTKEVDSQTLIQAIKAITLSNSSTPFSDCTTAKAVAEALVGTGDDSETVEAFAAVVAKYLSTTCTPITYDSDSYTGDVGAAGYYLVLDETTLTSTDYDAKSAYMLQVVGAAEVNEKRSIPSLVKTVDDVNDSSNAKETAQTYADYDIGDDVPFTLIAILGDEYYEKYDEYTLTFHDTLSSGLDFNDDVIVTVYTPFKSDGSSLNYAVYQYDSSTKTFTEYEAQATLTSGETYYIKTEVAELTAGGYTVSESSGVITIAINDTNKLSDGVSIDYISVTSGSIITAVYTAELLSTTSNYPESNEAYITYSNDPNSTSTGTSEKSRTYVYTYSLKITKYKSDGTTALSNAGFTLYKKVIYCVTVPDDYDETAYGYYTKNSSGELEKLSTTPSTNDDVYIVVKVLASTDATGTGSNIFTFTGLDDGHYVLVESTTPAGYNTMDDIYFTIASTTNTNGIATLTATDTGSTGATFSSTPSTGEITTDIKNYSGSELPETGGIGVTIFYVVGGILVLAAAGVIVINRKKIKK